MHVNEAKYVVIEFKRYLEASFVSYYTSYTSGFVVCLLVHEVRNMTESNETN